MTTRTRRTLVTILAGFSVAATISGLMALTAFDQAPGDAFAAPAHWPDSTALQRRPNRASLLVFVHPLCSCTGATIAELARLRVAPNDAAIPVIIFVAHRPTGDSMAVQNTWVSKASALPGASLVWDDLGLEARRFGATTSGYVLLYDAAGDLLFHGGVTGSRGHEGDNYGLASLQDSLRTTAQGTAHSVTRSSRVFGCPLATLPHIWKGIFGRS